VTKAAKSRKKATFVVKRQYMGNSDMEKAFTEVLTRALVKLPPQPSTKLPPPHMPCLPKILSK
jgi:hypothetical protein